MKTINITDLICTGFEGHNDELREKIEVNDEYEKAQKIFDKHLETLKGNFSYMSEIEKSEIDMETIAMDTAFNEGFKLAIRLIMSSMN